MKRAEDRRLSDSGVQCEVQVLFLKVDVVRSFWQSHVAALRRALFPGSERDGLVTKEERSAAGSY